MKIIVYETFQHVIPTGEGWASGLEDLGHTVYRLPSHTYSLCEVDEQIDVVVILSSVDPSRYKEVIRYKEDNPKTKICFGTLNYNSIYDELLNTVDIWIEMVMKHSRSEEEFKRRGLKLIFVPLAANNKIFFPTGDEKIHDISFIGTMGAPGEREEDKYLFPVMKQPYRGIFSGFNGFPHILHTSVNKVYNQTRVNLNFHFPYQKAETSDPQSRIDFNGRVYEVSMSGNFQVCDHPSVVEVFKGTIPYVPKEKWLETIEYYVKNETERNQMARASREICLKDHSWKRRMEEFLQKI